TLAQPMTFTGTLDQNQDDIKAPVAQLTVTPYGTKYLASASSDVLDTRIRAWIADNPDGPGQYLGVAATETGQQGQLGYDAQRVGDRHDQRRQRWGTMGVPPVLDLDVVPDRVPPEVLGEREDVCDDEHHAGADEQARLGELSAASTRRDRHRGDDRDADRQ